MDVQQAKAILAALAPEVRAERQRLVDLAVREARGNGYCGSFNSLMSQIAPEMCVEQTGGYLVALDSDGRPCGRYDLEERPRFLEDGYDDQDGRDRDGYDRYGYDRDGFDRNGYSRSRTREYRDLLYTDEDGDSVTVRERMYLTGYGDISGRDADGNLRPGRPATPEELVAETTRPSRFNPTTWQPDEE